MTFPVAGLSGAGNTSLDPYRNLGDGATGYAPNGSVIIADDFSWLVNNHSLRFGAEYRQYYQNERSSQGNGSYTFHSEITSQPGFRDSTGFSYASFFLGDAYSTGMGIQRFTPGLASKYVALYTQDDWKMRPGFTLNAGIRWDIPTPVFERTDRMSGLDPTLANPGADNYPGAMAFGNIRCQHLLRAVCSKGRFCLAGQGRRGGPRRIRNQLQPADQRRLELGLHRRLQRFE